MTPYRKRKLEEGASLERKRKNLNGILKFGLEAFVETGLVPRREKASGCVKLGHHSEAASNIS